VLTVSTLDEILGTLATSTLRVARLDGARLQDEDDVFHAFSLAFRFPEWFGWNWDALRDCLRMLDGVRADRYLVLVDKSGAMLADRPRERELLLSILHDTQQLWANPLRSGRREPVPFDVVLLG
jgi:RNAse (barnase) inhibitor barstar